MEHTPIESITARDTSSIIENLFSAGLKKEHAGRTSVSRVDGIEHKGEEKAPVYINGERLEKIEKRINEYLKKIETELEVEIHKETNTPIFKVINKETQQVIAEVPPSRLLDLAAKMSEKTGSLIDNNI